MNKSYSALKEIYDKKGLDFDKDLPYLQRAHSKMQRLWDDNFSKMDKVKLVIIGEAPLWGSKESYIYNPKTKHTAFFYSHDLEPIIGYVVSTKTDFLEQLQRLGILILDVSPFALNPDDTQLTYRGMGLKTYTALVDSCWEEHIGPVLARIGQDDPYLLFRYKTVMDIFGPIFTDKTGVKRFEHLSNSAGGLDRHKLHRLYTQADTR